MALKIMLEMIQKLNQNYQNPSILLTGDFNKPKWEQ